MRSTSHTAPLYASFSIFLLLPPSGQNNFRSPVFISINNSKLLRTPHVKIKKATTNMAYWLPKAGKVA